MSIPGERSHWTSKESPLVLRPLAGDKFELEADGQTLTLDHGGEDIHRVGEGLLGERENPEPGTLVLFKAGEEIQRRTYAKSVLDANGIDQIDDWLSQQEPADKLTVEVDSHAITRQELGRLAHLADRHDLSVEIRLRGDG